MGKRAGKRRTERKKLIYAIEQAKKRDEQARPRKEELPPLNLPPLLLAPPPARVLPRIREEYTVVGLPPLIKMVARVPPTVKKPSSPTDILHLFPEELDRDLDWSPDEFDREYFQLWEEEREGEFRKKRNRKREKLIGMFGMDSDIEREMEKDKRRDQEIDLFGWILSTDEEVEEVERMEVEKDKDRKRRKGKSVKRVERGRKQEGKGMEIGKRIGKKMEVEEKKEEKMEVKEKKEEKMEIGKGIEEKMEVEEKKEEKMEIEEKKEEKMEIEEKKEGMAKREAGASRSVVPNKIRGHWLKSKTRLDLSTSLY